MFSGVLAVETLPGFVKSFSVYLPRLKIFWLHDVLWTLEAYELVNKKNREMCCTDYYLNTPVFTVRTTGKAGWPFTHHQTIKHVEVEWSTKYVSSLEHERKGKTICLVLYIQIFALIFQDQPRTQML